MYLILSPLFFIEIRFIFFNYCLKTLFLDWVNARFSLRPLSTKATFAIANLKKVLKILERKTLCKSATASIFNDFNSLKSL